jgi:hypothetical protein
LLALAGAAEARSNAAVSHHGLLLRRAVELVLHDVGALFLDVGEDASSAEIIHALSEDHLQS